jgi:arginyl-tRNA synthetase
VFDFDHMLDPKGNTGVYLIYAYVRVCAILRKAEHNLDSAPQQFSLSCQAERDLAVTLLRMPEQLEAAAKELMCNRLCEQLFEITQSIGDFYGKAKVLGSPEQQSRVALLVATKKVMEVCFDLLGMKTVQRL